MNKIRNILMLVIILLVLVSGINVSAQEKQKVKVYVFEAVGCPACDAQKEYLTNLSKTNDKFELVVKELYKDNREWKPSTHYELGVNVVNAFLEKGYKDAKYTATPFVVVGTKYAAAQFNSNMESIINTAYEEQQEDVVACFEKGQSNCASLISENDSVKQLKQVDTYTKIFLAFVVVAGIGYFLVKKYRENNK